MTSSIVDQQFLDLIYAMPFDASLWLEIMARVSDETGSMGAVLQSPPKVNGGKDFELYAFHNFRPEDMAYGIEHYSQSDPFSGPMLAKLSGNYQKIAHGFGAIGSLDALKGNGFWHDYQKRMGMGDVLGLILHEPAAQAWPVLSVVKKRDNEAFDPDQIANFQALAYHLRFATRLRFKLLELDNLASDVTAVFDHIPTPCALLGAQGNAVLINEAMADFVAGRSAISLSNGRFMSLTKRVDDELQRAIAMATRGVFGVRTGAEVVVPDDLGGKLVVLVTPAGERNAVIYDQRSACAALYVLRESVLGPDERQTRRLKAILRLSDQEAQVARDMMAGLAPEEIARLHDKSVLTIRTQVRSILTKNNLRRAGDLQAMRRLFDIDLMS